MHLYDIFRHIINFAEYATVGIEVRQVTTPVQPKTATDHGIQVDIAVSRPSAKKSLL